MHTSRSFLCVFLDLIMTSITSGSDTEHLGIPKAVFVEDVDSFMQQPENDSADTVIRR